MWKISDISETLGHGSPPLILLGREFLKILYNPSFLGYGNFSVFRWSSDLIMTWMTPALRSFG